MIALKASTVWRAAGCAALLFAVGVVAVPYLSADRYGERLRASVERALGGNRRVELGKVRFSLLKGPAFSVDQVTIYEDPSIGNEPFVYIQEPGSLEVSPSLWSLLGGKFVISSIRLDEARINLAKTGPASEWGRWNFTSFLNLSALGSSPAIHVRNSRVNVSFGGVKSIFYLTQTDFDVSPPASGSGGWSVQCAARPARTDRSGAGLGAFKMKGRWYVNPERVDLTFDVQRSPLDEVTTLVRGFAGGVHGEFSSSLHLAGPLHAIGVEGRINIADVHRWDMLPQGGNNWPIDIRGRLDLRAQQLELESAPRQNAPLPALVTLKLKDYLSQPRWNIGVKWNRFPVEPVMELARHMGAQIPPGLKLGGSLEGALEYSDQGALAGGVVFHEASLSIPDSQPVSFDEARLDFAAGQARLAPTTVRTSNRESAVIEAGYDMAASQLELSIAARSLDVAALHSQAALAAVPWVEQLRAGQWTGDLRYRSGGETPGWTGKLDVKDAEIEVPGFASPLRLAAARAQIEGHRVALDRVEGSLGKLAFTGDYRYEPSAARPHRFHLRAGEVDAAALEDELAPTLSRAGLLARALGRAAIPDWMRQRQVDGTLQLAALTLDGQRLENFRARLLWDVARVELEGIQAALGKAAVSGALVVNLRGGKPSYRLAAKVKGFEWQGGKVDGEGTLEAAGVGAQLRSSLTGKGAFNAAGADFGLLAPLRAASGNFNLEWWQAGPRLRLTGLNLRAGEETFTGRGATQDDGKLVVLLNSGAREIRLSGTLSKLKLDDSGR